MPCRSMRILIVWTLALSGMAVASCGGDSGEPSRATDIPVEATVDAAVTSTVMRPERPTRTSESVPSAEPESTTSDTEAPTATERAPAVSPTPMGPTPTIPPVPTRVPPPPPATVTGAGSGLSAPVQFPVGLAVITMNHTGSGPFRVRLQNADLDYDRPVGDGTGVWKGSMGVALRDAGEYLFSVQSGGDWQIDVMWPTPENAPVAETPFVYSGTGDQAIYFVVVQTGSRTLSITHDGAGAFMLTSITSEGRQYIEKISGSGSSVASREFMIRDKAFEFLLLNVEATGNWTVELQ